MQHDLHSLLLRNRTAAAATTTKDNINMGGPKTLPKLPVIDLSTAKLKPAGTSSRKFLAGEVLRALEDYGCFVAVYDQMPLKLHDEAMESLEELFGLPLEIKAGNTANEPKVTYYPPWSALPLTDAFSFRDGATLEGTQRFTDLIWPSGNQTFCDRAMAHSTHLAELLELVRRMVLEGYGVDHKGYGDEDDSDRVGLAYIEYIVGIAEQKRPLEINEFDKDVISHSDKCLLTAYDQNEVKALLIKTRDGQWVSYDPAPSHFLILAGDAIMAWSNGRIHAPYHVHGPREPGKDANYVFSLSSYMRDLVETPKELVDDQHPLLFKPFDNLGLLEFSGTNYPSTITDYCGVNN